MNHFTLQKGQIFQKVGMYPVSIRDVTVILV